MRSLPLRFHAGRISEVAPFGQVFRCEADGLERIDVTLVTAGPESGEVELQLRREGPGGEVVRRVLVEADPLSEPELVTFRFEPIPESAGRWFHFQLVPAGGAARAGLSPWIRFHGQTGRDDPWGAEVVEGKDAGGYFQSPTGDLRGIAVACESMVATERDVRLTLWDLDDGGATRREITLATPTAIETGYALLSFEPIPNSKGRNYGYRLDVGTHARFNARFDRPTIKTLHGLDAERAALGGMTTAGRIEPDRDLVFRAWTASGPAAGLRIARERAGWRLWAGVGLWLLTLLALARMLAPAASSGGGPAPHETGDPR